MPAFPQEDDQPEQDSPTVPASSLPAMLNLQREAYDLREQGNRWFGRGDYKAALEFYARSATECLETLPDDDVQLRSGFLLQTFTLAQSNKVEALLRLGNISKAFHEAELALQFNPDHVKTLTRKARALQKRQFHQLARECLVKALEVSPENPELQAELSKSELLCEQQQNGSHDVAGFILGPENQELEPEFADYIGPVEVRMTEDGKGRGLFVTRNVEAGELLLATNAAVYNVVGARYGLEACLKELKHLAQDSFSMLKCLISLAQKESVPEMEAFRPSVGFAMHELGSEYEVNMRLLNTIYNDNLVRVQGSGSNHREGLWILPSFINHSCRPNACQHLLGRVAFNIASVPIPAGGEVMCSYFDTLVPWNPIRREESSRIGEFECNCERCSLEKSLEMPLAQLSKTFQVHHSKEYETRSAAEKKRIRAGYSRIVRELELHLSGDSPTEEEKQWIRASYIDAYFYQSEVPFEPSKLARAVRMACPTDIRVLRKIYNFARSCRMEGVGEIMEMIEEACVSIYGSSARHHMRALAHG